MSCSRLTERDVVAAREPESRRGQDDRVSLTGYLASVDLEHELRDEMAAAGRRASRHPHGRLVVSADEPMQSVWAANVWRNVEQIPITSIGHAAKELRDRQRNWALYAPLHGGRARLIAEKLPSVSAKPVPIGGAAPDAPLGSWTLLRPDLMLAAGDCSSPFPNGEAQLVQNREGPPSRAYLKLYESFVRMRRWPRAGETCLDLGASPGGWTWLLGQTGASVLAVDKAPLADHVGRMHDVRWQQGSAFALEPPPRSACRLAVQRHHLLPTAPAPACSAVVRRRRRSQHHLHDQVPGRHRPGSGARVPGHPGWAGAPPAPQPPRADVHPRPGRGRRCGDDVARSTRSMKHGINHRHRAIGGRRGVCRC